MIAMEEHACHSLIRLAPDPVFLLDPDSGRIVETNDRAAQLLGYELPALESMSLARIFADDGSAAVESILDDAERDETLRADEGPDGEQLFFESRSGDRVPVKLHARPVTLEGAECIYAIARDVTEQFEQQRELERQNDRLERFARIVSHDLRNPLNVAKGRVDLARTECPSTHLDTVSQAHDRMESLITNLLTVAREGKSSLDLEPVQLDEFVVESWQTVETNGARLENDTTSCVVADKIRLRQLLENLVRNAVEHTDRSVTITVGELADGFYVEDDGPGIPAADRTTIFENGYSTDPDGTGFGLSIVATVVEEHDWSITVAESASGGARFEITGVTKPI